MVVVGAGPGGLFAALRLIEAGYRPVIVERGKNVRDRKLTWPKYRVSIKWTARAITVSGKVAQELIPTESCTPGSKKRGNAEKILNVFCQHGASVSILQDAHPHIGTDKLPRVIENMRKTILDCGGEVHFETRMDALLIEKDTVVGDRDEHGEDLPRPGHSGHGAFGA